MRAASALGVLLLVLAGCSEAPSGPRQPRALPDVQLERFGPGAPADLGDLEGPAVLNVWASWCGPCKRELPLYQAFAAAHAGTVRVLGIDFKETSRAEAEGLVRESGVRYPLYADPDGKVGSRVLPELILVDREGEVVFRKYVEITSVAQLEKLVDTHLEAAS